MVTCSPSVRPTCRARFAGTSRSLDLAADEATRAIEDDLRARDMTVGALAWSLRDDAILDPLGGLDDWRDQRIVPVGDRGAWIATRDPISAFGFATYLALDERGASIADTPSYTAADAAPRIAVESGATREISSGVLSPASSSRTACFFFFFRFNCYLKIDIIGLLTSVLQVRKYFRFL